jgi:hypothetical protein
MKKTRTASHLLLVIISFFIVLFSGSVIATEHYGMPHTTSLVETHDTESYRVVSPTGSGQSLQIHKDTTIGIPESTTTNGYIVPQQNSVRTYGGTDWSNSGGNEQRNGRSDTSGPITEDLLWSGARSSIISWLPVTEGERLFVIRQKGWPGTNNDSPIIAMNLSSGTELWSVNIPYHSGDWTTWIAGAKNGIVDRKSVV